MTLNVTAAQLTGDPSAIAAIGLTVHATNAVSLTVAQFDAIRTAGIHFVASDSFTLSGSAAEITARAASDLTNIGTITVTDATWSLTLAQYQTLHSHGLTIDQSQTVTLDVTAAQLKDATSLKAITDAGLTVHVTDTVTLTVAQADLIAATSIKFVNGQTFTLLDTADHIQVLEAQHLTALESAGASGITISDNLAVTLSAAQATALSVKITTTGGVTVSGAAADLLALIGGKTATTLTGYGITSLDVTGDGAVTLTIEQYQALNAAGLHFAATDVVTLSGLSDRIVTETLAADLHAFGVSKVDATNDTWVLTVAQYQAAVANGLTFAVDAITIQDAYLELRKLTAEQIDKAPAGASLTLTATDSTLRLDFLQFNKLVEKNATLTGQGGVTILASEADFKALKPNDVTDLQSHGVNRMAVFGLSTVAWSIDATQAKTLFYPNGGQGLKLTGNQQVTLTDSADAIKTIGSGALAAIRAALVSQIDVTDPTPWSLNADEFKALASNGFSFVAGDTFTLSDTGQNIAAKLGPNSLAKLATFGALVIDASDNVVSLSLGQYNALKDTTLRFAANDTLTLTASADVIKALDPAALTALHAFGFSKVATGGAWSLTFAQAKALLDAGLSFVEADDTTLTGSAADITVRTAGDLVNVDHVSIDDLTWSLTLAQFRILHDHGLVIRADQTVILKVTSDQVKTTADLATMESSGLTVEVTDAVSLTYAQYDAVSTRSINFVDNQSFILSDTAANIHGLDALKLKDLTGSGALGITVSDKLPVTFDASQAAALGLKISGSSGITVADTGANISTKLGQDQLGKLAGYRVTLIDASDPVTLTSAQYDALKVTTLRFAKNDDLTLSASADAINGFNAAALTALHDFGFTKVDATDSAWSLSFAQLKALKDAGISLVGADDITLTGSAADLKGRSDSDLANIDHVTISDTTWSLTLAQLATLSAHGLTVAQSQTVTLADTAANFASQSSFAALSGMANTAVTVTDTDHILALSVAQYRDLIKYTHLTAADTVILSDTSAHIAGLSITELGALASNHVDVIDSSDNAPLAISLDQYQQLGVVKFAANDTVVLTDTAAHIASMTVDQLRGLGTAGVDKIDVSGNAIDLSLAQYKAAVSSVTFAADDMVTAQNGRDFNRDGHSDILLQNSKTGDVYLWDMNGTSIASKGAFGWSPSSVYVAKGTGDFDNNGYTDVLLQNSRDGSCFIWEKTGPDNGSTVSNTLVRAGTVGWAPGADYRVVGVGDFNGDHTSDILLQNATNGDCFVFEVDATKPLDGGAAALKAFGSIGTSLGVDWAVKGVGDFNGDGVSDIFLQNVKTGQCWVWDVDGSQPLGGTKTLKDSSALPSNPGVDWQVKLVGDFNNDGRDDVLLQNAKTGDCNIWELNGANVIGAGKVGWSPTSQWEAKAAGDFNGDGKTDVLIQNATSNQYYIWELNGTDPLVGYGEVKGNLTSDWHAIT